MPRAPAASHWPLAVRAVAIDLDGTLADTIPDLTVAANAMLVELGGSRLDAGRLRTFVGQGIPRFVERALDAVFGEAQAPAFLPRALELFERSYTEVNGRHSALYPGVREGLEALADMRLPLACITNKAGRYAGPLLERLGIARYFAQVVAGDTVSRKKPDPEPLLHACRRFGIAPAQMMLVGDSANDARAARAAGCPVVCVPYGYNEGRDVRELDVDAIVSTLIEASKLVRKA